MCPPCSHASVVVSGQLQLTASGMVRKVPNHITLRLKTSLVSDVAHNSRGLTHRLTNKNVC